MNKVVLVIFMVVILAILAFVLHRRSKRTKTGSERDASPESRADEKFDTKVEAPQLDLKPKETVFEPKPKSEPEPEPESGRPPERHYDTPAHEPRPTQAPIPREFAPVEQTPVVFEPRPAVIPPVPEQPAPAAPRLAPMVYIVDDSVVVRTKLLRLITGAGYRVQSGNDGVMGLALMKAALPDLLITDIEMPEMDGYALIAALHADSVFQRIPVVAISGHDGIRERLVDFPNVVDAFKKPWDAPVLLARLEELVGPGILPEQA